MSVDDCALVVGINRYPGLTPLAGAENDARSFHDWVTDAGGGDVPAANARMILSSDFQETTDVNLAEPATRAIEDFFTWVDERSDANNAANRGARAGARLWMFFSGHGFSPSLDRSGVLTANATPRRVHNVAARMWADRLHEGGWFDDVILFQDACQTRIKDADLNPPFLRKRMPSNRQVRRRFYAFAASDDKVAKEVTLADGTVGGVFTATLVQGLRGFARDAGTGALRSAGLTEHLRKNMGTLLPAADLDDDDVAKGAAVHDPEPFDILPPPADFRGAQRFPVTIVTAAGAKGVVLDGSLKAVVEADRIPSPWTLDLPVGLYQVVVADVGDAFFQVGGRLEDSGAFATEIVHV